MLYPRSIQVARTLRYLPQDRWRSTVVCARAEDDAAGDILDRELDDRYGGSYLKAPVSLDEPMKPPRRVFDRWRRRLFPTEDTQEAAWVDRGADRVLSCGRVDGCDVLVTFAQPWSDHLIGLRVRRRLGRPPWVAHFSDPWVDSPYYEGVDPVTRRSHERLERRIIRLADAVVFVTQETADLVMRKYPDAYRSKVHVIPHCFDPELAQNLAVAKRPPSSRLRIMHTGNLLSGKRTPDGLLDSLVQLQDDPDLRGAIEFTFIGASPPETIEKARDAGLDDVVRFTGRRSYLETLAAAAGADALLLIDAPAANSVFLPSKLVDYLMFRKPILGLTPENGASAHLLRGAGCPVVAPDDVPAIANLLRDTVQRWRSGELRVAPEFADIAARYDARTVSGRFAELLDHCADAGQRRRWWRLGLTGRTQ